MKNKHEIPFVQKKIDFPLNLFDKDNLPELYGVISRNIKTGLFNVAAFANYEEIIRYQALLNIEVPIAEFSIPIGMPEMLEMSEKDLFFLVHETADKELKELIKKATPIGKATLPTMINMFEYPKVIELVAKGEHWDAMLLFRDEFRKKTHSDTLTGRILKYGSWALGVSAAALSSYQIAKSDNRLLETVHQGVLLGSGVLGSLEAGALASTPCAFFGVAAPVCIAGASLAGGVIGTEIGEKLFQQAKKLASGVHDFRKGLEIALRSALVKGGVSEGLTAKASYFTQFAGVGLEIAKIGKENSVSDALSIFSGTFDSVKNFPPIKTPKKQKIKTDTTNNFQPKSSRDEVFEYAKAIVSGAKHGIGSIIDTVLHPLDNLLYPVTDLVYDATIILAGYTISMGLYPSFQLVNPDLKILYGVVGGNPKLYGDAEARMQERLNFFKKVGQAWSQASGPKRLEMLTSVGVSILAPGWILKSAKIINNKYLLGVPFNPPKFHSLELDKFLAKNISTFEKTIEKDIFDKTILPRIQYKTVSDIRKQDKLKAFMYVITEEGKLLICDESFQVAEFGKLLFNHVTHPEMALKRPVYLAGEIRVENGVITYINEFSGHFKSFGPHLDAMVTRVFIRHGYYEVHGKFNRHFKDPDKFLLINSKGDIPAQRVEEFFKNRSMPIVSKDPMHVLTFSDLLLGGALTDLNLTLLRPEKDYQKEQVQQTLVKERLREGALNPFAPKKSNFTHLNWFQPFQPRPYSWFYHYNNSFPFNYLNQSLSYLGLPKSMKVRGAVKDALESEMRSLRPSFFSAYYRACAQLGLGYSLSLSEFRDIASSTSLTIYYNTFHPNSSLRDVINFCREIGGVASEVAIITDLLDSEEQAKAEEYFLCFPENQFSFNQEMLMQIFNELYQAYSQYQATPYFSLQFNNKNGCYPLIHPAFQNTLVGEIIGLLDYGMKGYMKGGIYDPKFLTSWHETENYDEDYLRKKMIYLKKYCKENLPDFDYISHSELRGYYGLTEFLGVKSEYQQAFMTSFRIIAHSDIKRHENVLVFQPKFRIEHDVDLSPDYKNYLDEYVKAHGEYPENFQKMQQCNESFAQEIKEKMPKLPFFRDFFGLLGVMNAFGYLFSTLQKMGKSPVLESKETKIFYQFPKVLPPIPSQYFRSYPLKIIPSDIAKLFSEEDDPVFESLFYKSSMHDFPPSLVQKIRLNVTHRIASELKEELLKSGTMELYEESVEHITKKSVRYCMTKIRQINKQMNKSLQRILGNLCPPLPIEESKLLLTKIIPEKIKDLSEKHRIYFDESKNKLDKFPNSVKNEIFNCIPNFYHEQINEIFSKLEKENKEDIESEIIKRNNLIEENCKESLERERKSINANIERLSELDKKVRGNIAEYQQNKANSQIQAEIQKNQKVLTEIAEKINKLSAKLKESETRLPMRVAIKQKEFAEAIHKEAAVILQNAYQQESIRVLGLLYKKTTEDLDKLESNVLHFSKKFQDMTQGSELVISKKYIHSCIKFTDELDESGTRMRIVGGCKMELPNKESEPLQQAEAFIAAMKFAESHFEFQGEPFVSFKVPVQSAQTMKQKAENEDLSAAELAHIGLESFCMGEASVEVIAEDFVKKGHTDKSGASLMHYAASVATPEHFKQLTKVAVEQINQADQLGNLPIHAAAMGGNVGIVENLIQQESMQLNAQNHRGATPLMLAIQHGKIEVVKVLLSRNVDVNTLLPSGLCPLFLAIQNNYPDIALLLIQHSGHSMVNVSLDSGETPLHLAIERELYEVATQLLEAKARCDVRRNADGHTPFHRVAEKGLVALARLMLKSGISVDLSLESKKTPLHLAAENGRMEMVQYLVGEVGASIDAQTIQGETPLMLAIKAGHPHVAEFLVSHCKINLVNQKDQTSSLLAARCGMFSVADRLLVRGEDPELKDIQNYNLIYQLINQGEYYRFKQLLEKGQINLNQSFDGRNLVAVAAERGQFLLVSLLLEKGLKFEAAPSNPLELVHYAAMADEIGFLVKEDKGSSKVSLAYLAIKHGSQHCVEVLLKMLSNEEIRTQNLLLAAVESLNPVIMDQVIKRTSDVNQTLDQEDNTALHSAVAWGSRTLVELLLERGCDIQLKNNQGKTPFHLAALQGDAYILKRLLKLTRPADWPKDLWNYQTLKPSKSIRNVLEKHKKRLTLDDSKPIKESSSALEEKKSEETLYISDEKTISKKLIEELNHLLDEEYFDDAADLIDKTPELLTLFKSKQGGLYLKRIFSNIRDYSKESAEFKKKHPSEENPYTSARNLLSLLKEKEINPAQYLGKDNLLLTIMSAENDGEACYRLSAFTEYFSESLLVLAKDPYPERSPIAVLAIKKNFRNLFEQLDHYCVFYGLHEAVLSDNFILVKKLLERRPDSVDLRNERRQTPLMLAASQGNICIIQLLLANGANIHAFDNRGDSVLHYAIIGESEEAALLLASQVSQLSPNRRGETPLILAAFNGKSALVRYLCETSDHTHAVNDWGRNALHVAAIAGKVDVIEYLVSHGFAIDQLESPVRASKIKSCSKHTSLQLAALHGHADAVQKLLELGADTELRDRHGFSFCEHAVLSNKIEMLQLVQQLPFYHSKEHTACLLHAAVIANNTQVVCEFILEEADLNVLTPEGFSVLHLAAMHNSGDVVDLLLLPGNDIPLDLEDCVGNTALHQAATHGHVRMIEALIAAGASIDKTNRFGETPLFLASKDGRLGAVVAFLKYQANMAIGDCEGTTPLKVALNNRHEALAKRLKLRGAPETALLSISWEPLVEDDTASSEKDTSYYEMLDQKEQKIPDTTSDEQDISFHEVKSSELKELKQPLTTPFLEDKKVEIKENKENPKEKELIMQEVDYKTFQKRSRDFIQENYPKNSHDWINFLKKLNIFEGRKSEKFMLLKSVFIAFDNRTTCEELIQFMELSLKLKSKHGVIVFKSLLEMQTSYLHSSICAYISIFQLLVESPDPVSSFSVIEKNKLELFKILEALQNNHKDYLSKKFLPRDIDQTIKYFSGENKAVEFPLSQKELCVLKEEYLAIKSEMDLLQSVTTFALSQKIQEISKLWQSDKKPEFKHQLLALITESIYRIYKIRPHDTQILALLGLINHPVSLKGRIAQIKTGEGKSLLIAMLAAFKGLGGEYVDIVTSSESLAIRDCKKYKPFFTMLGLSTSHICCLNPNKSDFNAFIVYGIASNEEFTLLRDSLRNEPHRQTQHQGVYRDRPYQVVIVDEVDNLFLQPNSALISTRDPENITWIYQPIFEFVQKNITLGISPVSIRNAQELRQYLLEYSKEKHQKEYINRLSDADLKRWLRSAWLALTEKIKDRDYVVKENKAGKLDIVIVDYANTGRLLPGSHWKHGLHQFLQIKEGLTISPNTLTIASTTHPTFFTKYENLYGFTGSIGPKIERDEIEDQYHVDSFDTPSHLPNRREVLPAIFVRNPQEYIEKLTDYLRSLHEKKRPVLVLFNSIKESEKFSEYLKSNHIKHYLLNENQRESEEYIVSRGGEERAIIVATNTAGRGTDFILTEKSIELGGLETIFTFYPKNLRVEIQGYGRSARLGQPGSAVMFLNLLEDDMIKYLLSKEGSLPLILKSFDQMSSEKILEDLDDLRTKDTEQESNRRKEMVEKENIYFKKLQSFFLDLKRVYKVLEDEKLKSGLLNTCNHFLGNIVAVTKILHGSHWKLIYSMVENLLEKKLRGISVDWSQLIRQFKKAYVKNIKIIWSKFYSKIQDDLSECVSLEEANLLMENAYAEVLKKLAPYCQGDIGDNAIRCLNVVLNQVLNKIQNQIILNTASSQDHIYQTSIPFFSHVNPSLEEKLTESKFQVSQSSLVSQMFQGVMKTGEELKRESTTQPITDLKHNDFKAPLGKPKPRLKSIMRRYGLTDNSPAQLEIGVRRILTTASFAFQGHLHYLIGANANVNGKDPDTGKTALHLAVEKGSFSWVKLLLDHGALNSIEDNSGRKPSDYPNLDPKTCSLLTRNLS
jgi:ankyrin repeat protein/preprotein translocase subunit SecA